MPVGCLDLMFPHFIKFIAEVLYTFHSHSMQNKITSEGMLSNSGALGIRASAYFLAVIAIGPHLHDELPCPIRAYRDVSQHNTP